MLTVREHLDFFKKTGKIARPLWIHGLDALAHVLKGDHKDTFFGDPGYQMCYLHELQSHLDGKPKEVDSFLEAKHNAFVQERRWKRFDSESGDLNVDRYLDGELRPFDDHRKKYIDKPAVTIVMDVSVPHHDRNGDSVGKRHERIYKYACDANKEGRPCRVVACDCRYYTESELDRMPTMMVLKDFDDPIFPAIWAAFEKNLVANSWANSMADFLLGTAHTGNGRYVEYDPHEDIQGEIILVEPKTWLKENPRLQEED